MPGSGMKKGRPYTGGGNGFMRALGHAFTGVTVLALISAVYFILSAPSTPSSNTSTDTSAHYDYNPQHYFSTTNLSTLLHEYHLPFIHSTRDLQGDMVDTHSRVSALEDTLEEVILRLAKLEGEMGTKALQLPKSHQSSSMVQQQRIPPSAKEYRVKATGSAIDAKYGKSWDPLWHRPHNPKKDAIFGLALGYKLRDFERFVGSLRRTGFDGDIVLAVTPEIDQQIAEFLKASDCIVYPLYARCEDKLKCQLDRWFVMDSPTAASSAKNAVAESPYLPMAIIRHYLYLNWLQHYDESSLIYVFDFRDTVFQRHPFVDVDRNAATDLYLFAEHYPYKTVGTCIFNGGWIKDCMGREQRDVIFNQSVICSGSILGPKKGLEQFELILLNQVDNLKCHMKHPQNHFSLAPNANTREFLGGVESDQGYTNWLYHTGRLHASGLDVVLYPRGYGPVNTVGALNGKAHGYPIGPLGSFYHMLDADGYILNDDKKTRSAVVHQWDRFYPELNKFIDATLRCDTGCLREL